MPQAIRYTLLSLRDLLVSVGPFLVLAVGLLGLAYWWLNPTPPKRVVLATGPAQSAYAEFGKRYAKALAANGIEVVLKPSEGSSANLQLLRDGEADLGFVQGGTSDRRPEDEDNLLSLGSLFVEPVWLFYRDGSGAIDPSLSAAATAAASAAVAAASSPTAPADASAATASSAASDTAPMVVLAGTPAPGASPPARTGGASGNPVRSSLKDLQGLRVNVGTPGSGVPSMMTKLIEANRIDPAGIRLSQLEQTPATTAFLGGELDALVFASAPEAVMVQLLLQTPGVRLMDFPQSEAYARRFAFLSSVMLPRGVVDLAGDVPPQNLRLVATTTALLAREDTHPALLQLFSQAAQGLHSGAGWFNRARQFPNIDNNELPIAKEAERTIKNGPPLMQRYLPFWMANLIERMWLALGLILAALLPLSRIVPPLYTFRIRRRIFRWYAQLRDIEHQIDAPDTDPAALSAELEKLDAVAGKIPVPLSYTDELYALRGNIELVRQRLRRMQASG